jgi:hypothetical protein
MMKLALMRTTTGKEVSELHLLQRIHLLHAVQTGHAQVDFVHPHHTEAIRTRRLKYLNQLYSFGVRMKSIIHLWQFS